MRRIAVLIVLAVLALNGGLLRPALAEGVTVVQRPESPETVRPLAVRSGRVVMLLLALEALRFTQPPVNPPKG